MKFSEIANRLTGISTPFGGASWQPAELGIAGARRVIAFLEDRRVLYDPCEMEVPDHCVRSVIKSADASARSWASWKAALGWPQACGGEKGDSLKLRDLMR